MFEDEVLHARNRPMSARALQQVRIIRRLLASEEEKQAVGPDLSASLHHFRFGHERLVAILAMQPEQYPSPIDRGELINPAANGPDLFQAIGFGRGGSSASPS